MWRQRRSTILMDEKSSVLCDKRVLAKIKGKMYKTGEPSNMMALRAGCRTEENVVCKR